MQLEGHEFDECIWNADLNDVANIRKDDFEHALCRFICEVKKCKEDGDYPGRILYQMTCCIQNYLRKNDVNWKLVHGNDFVSFQRVLDNVMQERSAKCLGYSKETSSGN